jgi:hypothetical protein
MFHDALEEFQAEFGAAVGNIADYTTQHRRLQRRLQDMFPERDRLLDIDALPWDEDGLRRSVFMSENHALDLERSGLESDAVLVGDFKHSGMVVTDRMRERWAEIWHRHAVEMLTEDGWIRSNDDDDDDDDGDDDDGDDDSDDSDDDVMEWVPPGWDAGGQRGLGRAGGI